MCRGSHGLMFPHPDHAPTGLGQRLVVATVPSNVEVELRSPPLPVCRWEVPVLGACMPEASVDEYRDPPAREHDVGLASDPSHWSMINPEAKPAPMQLAAEGELGTSVAAAVGLHRRPRPRRRRRWSTALLGHGLRMPGLQRQCVRPPA